MKGVNKITVAVLVVGLGFTEASSASLFDRGGGMIYDNDQSLTWLQDANYTKTSMDWYQANNWSENLIFGTYSNWRLPTIDEFRILYQVELGNKSYSETTNSTSPGWGLYNKGPFTNLQGYAYWTGTNEIYPTLAWAFYSNNGYQSYFTKDQSFGVWAVHPGDVAAVPVPAAFWLFTSGLGLLSFANRRKAQGNML